MSSQTFPSVQFFTSAVKEIWDETELIPPGTRYIGSRSARPNIHLMSRIKLLPETLASQVAAGEVVERPAFCVKELIENSIDAAMPLKSKSGFSAAAVHYRVIDDGCGMDRDDALLSLERHATSEIASVDDLAAINTLGFSGEALPSIRA